MNGFSRYLRIFACLVLGYFGAVGLVSAQEFVTNGSLTGPIANGSVPTGWTILDGSPDTMDETHNVGGGTPFTVTPEGPSPDGGTWVGFANGATGFHEIFGQTVTGLTIGTQYTVSWYAGNFGAETGPGYNGENSVLVSLDGSPIGSGALLPLAAAWVAQEITFTATATSHALSFGLVTDVDSYLSIDGISLTAGESLPPQAIPTLSELAMIMLVFLFGFVGWHRLRAAKN